MRRRCFLLLAICAAINLFFSTAAANEKIEDDFVEIELIFQHESVAPNSNSAVEIKFSLAENWHFYADKNTAPDQMNLEVIPQAKGLTFSKPVFPKGHLYPDKVTGKKLEVYSGSFSIFIPFTADANSQSTQVKVAIEGLSCSQQLCRKASYELTKKLDISASA
jgi:hypothetical protein